MRIRIILVMATVMVFISCFGEFPRYTKKQIEFFQKSTGVVFVCYESSLDINEVKNSKRYLEQSFVAHRGMASISNNSEVTIFIKGEFKDESGKYSTIVCRKVIEDFLWEINNTFKGNIYIGDVKRRENYCILIETYVGINVKDFAIDYYGDINKLADIARKYFEVVEIADEAFPLASPAASTPTASPGEVPNNPNQ